MFNYEDFIIDNSTSSIKSESIIDNGETISPETSKPSDLDYFKMMVSYETMNHNSLLLTESEKKTNIRLYSYEAEDDPFADLGEGLDDGGGGDTSFDDGSSDDVSFDSFEDSSDSVFGDSDFGSDMSDDDNVKSKALEVSRSDLLDESHNLGIQIRRMVPKKIKSIIDIVDHNLAIVNKSINKYGQFLDDLILIKDSYSDIKENVKEYLEIIDSKTFDELFSDYTVFLSLIDKVNEMYNNLLKHIGKQ